MKFRVPGKDMLYMMVYNMCGSCGIAIIKSYADGVAMQPASMHVK